ncbi:hypothetical protein SETIT_6G194000v2 [Setaria italica]|uniref:F-box associated beta-propeller type 3 domain-containing protein n=1 Tax=Setaria italica TaxID=4555 RepID=A0A368RN98_SETIT|nr:hypothetical protein SETIT_6G194000v2 [Setaria italica]
MAFDLKDERLVLATTLPVRVQPCLDLSWHLTRDLRGRLGFAVVSYEVKRTRTLNGSKTEVWVLEYDGGRDKKQRSKRQESSEWEQARAPGKYSFGYHPTTGKYKVVHIPCRRRQEVDAVQVFTLGGGDTTSWREVPVTAPGDASCNRLSEAISVDGRTYWLDASASRVMALDLADERVTSFAAPPRAKCPGLIPAAEAGWELTSVHGRLGAVVATAVMARVEVWVLDGGGAWPRWSRRYDIVEARPTTSGYWIAAPQLTHGEYILRASQDSTRDDLIWGCSWARRRLYRHKVGDLTGGDGQDDGQSRAVKGRELVMSLEESNGDLTTFAYVETLEPLPSIHG